MGNLIITPKTKVHELLEVYPELEDVLIDITPQFKKLRNPVLRNTVARITTLSQAAIIGGVKVEELINKLREHVGQNVIEVVDDINPNYTTTKPNWFDDLNVKGLIDIREMLNSGEQPVHEVLSQIKKLQKGDILKIISPFIPAPLLDKSLSMSYQHWLLKISDEEFWVYFINE